MSRLNGSEWRSNRLIRAPRRASVSSIRSWTVAFDARCVRGALCSDPRREYGVQGGVLTPEARYARDKEATED